MDIIAYDKVKLDKTAVALGKFQGLHRGHMMLIEKIVSLAQNEQLTSVVFTININSDRVINLPEERFAILDAIGVDVNVECEFSTEFAGMSPETFVKDILVDNLNVSYVVVGSDFRFGCNRMGNVDMLKKFGEKYGFSVIAFDKRCVNDIIISSSLIRELVESGRVEEVEKYMGRPYSVTGEVSYGKQLGRKIGFPTINIIPEPKKIIPPMGVYETEVLIDDIIYRGITNVGNNPTVENTDKIVVETNILDYDKELYGRHIKVNFKRFIREERKFNTIEELKHQMRIDKMSIMHQ